MKAISLLGIILLLGILYTHADTSVLQTRYIRYTEKVHNIDSPFQNHGLPIKSQRLSSNKDNIILYYDNNLSDSIQVALTAAKELWEAKLPLKQPIVICVEFGSMDRDILMTVDVLHMSEGNFIGAPTALCSQLENFQYGALYSPDGIIRFNKDIDWNCNFKPNDISNYNLPTMTIRGIARCLGFGSSIFELGEDEFYYTFGCPTYFDKMLHVNDIGMDTLEGGTPEMINFVTSNAVYAQTEANNYKIYAPHQFVQDLSLCYFDDDNSIMSFTLGQGNVALAIDDKTIDVLSSIGWYFPSNDLAIKCSDISDNGIGSSYSAHTFSLETSNSNIDNYHWKFFLKTKEGTQVLISESNQNNFTIDKITPSSDYFVNLNGDLEGVIKCEYTINNQSYQAIPFTIYLELKPLIISIDNIEVIKDREHGFFLKFNVRYTGADNLSVELEEEDDSFIRNYLISEPYIAHVTTGYMSNLYYNWVTIIVTNKYGSTYETIEFEPSYDTPGNSISQILDSTDDYLIKIYNINGNMIFSGTQNQFNNQTFQSGIYIKKEIKENGQTTTSKIAIH